MRLNFRRKLRLNECSEAAEPSGFGPGAGVQAIWRFSSWWELYLSFIPLAMGKTDRKGKALKTGDAQKVPVATESPKCLTGSDGDGSWSPWLWWESFSCEYEKKEEKEDSPSSCKRKAMTTSCQIPQYPQFSYISGHSFLWRISSSPARAFLGRTG